MPIPREVRDLVIGIGRVRDRREAYTCQALLDMSDTAVPALDFGEMSDDARLAATDLTALLRRWRDGDTCAREQLMEVVYDRVRAIAALSLQRQLGSTLTPTELAHEALMRLFGAEADWVDRKHFFHVVAQATRQVLVDRARRRLSDKRGSGAVALPLSQSEDVGRVDRDEDLVRVDDALSALGANDARQARIIEMTYFGGFAREEIASALALSVRTVDRDLRFARAWLKDAMSA